MIRAALSGFRVITVERFPAFQMTATLLEHDQTGAKHIHVDRNDDASAFALGFRTPPASSNGVPHILEHTVLCGSRQFRVRDPFFRMLGNTHE